MPNTVSTWRARYAGGGLAGLADKPRPGPKPRYTAETGRRILAVLERPPPAGFARWMGGMIAAELGDVHEQQVWRFLRDQRIDLDGKKSWCESDDAEFVAKAAEIVGLYVAPPDDAIVLCVDEKPSIQALERAQGYLRLPNGRALSGQSHDYTRHGTTTLFAALDLATGKVEAAHKSAVAASSSSPSWIRSSPLIRVRKSMPSSTTSTPTRRTRPGSPHIPTCTSTSPRRGLPGLIRSRSGSRSLPASRSAAPPSPPSPNSGDTSMTSSPPTTQGHPFVWTKAKSASSLQRPPYQPIVIPGTSAAVSPSLAFPTALRISSSGPRRGGSFAGHCGLLGASREACRGRVTASAFCEGPASLLCRCIFSDHDLGPVLHRGRLAERRMAQVVPELATVPSRTSARVGGLRIQPIRSEIVASLICLHLLETARIRRQSRSVHRRRSPMPAMSSLHRSAASGSRCIPS